MTNSARLERIKERRAELARLYREVSFHRGTRFSPSGPRFELTGQVNFGWLAQAEDLVLLVEADERPA